MKPLVILILTLATAVILVDISRLSNSDIGVLSNPVLLNGVDLCPHPDYAALVAFYNATNGPGWSNSTNWLDTCDVCMWYGIRCNSAMRVEEINLHRNNLTGVLPSEIGEFSALKNLYLDMNSMSGSIPPSITNLAPTLEELSLANNNFTGNIPPYIGNLTNLTFLVLENNLFSGSIPSEIGNLMNVEYFYAGGNNITGIPPEIGNMTSLRELVLFFSQLTGPIPRELGNLRNLEVLNLENNDLSGEIPVELGNIRTLTSLALTANDLSGPIPASFSLLSNLQSIFIGENDLSGPLLPELGNHPNLTRIELYDNNFEGCIPDSWRNLCPGNRVFLGNNPCLWQGTFNQFCSGVSCSFNDYTMTGSPSNLICSGSSADIIASGGSVYLWSTGATTSSITVSPQLDGWYYLTLTTPAGCTRVDSIFIIVHQSPVASASGTDVTMAGGNDGNASIVVIGGQSPYSYIWNTGAITSDLQNLTIGSYSCTITDANGCIDIASVMIDEPACLPPATQCDDGNSATYNDTEDGNCNCIGIPCPAISVGLEISNVSCFGGNDGSASVNPTGGIPPYTINWSSGTSGTDFLNLPSGEYTVSVTDAHGCQTVTNFDLAQPSALSSILVIVNESVPGATDGSINLMVSGGTLPYDYMWSNGETTQDISELSGSNTIYSVTVTDARGCQITDQVTLETGCFPPATLCDDGNSDTYNDTEDGNCNCLGFPCPVISDGLEINNVSCFAGNDGSALVNPTGGNSPYNINWSTGSSGTYISNLPAGDYTVSITDVNGCQSVTDFVLSQPLGLLSTLVRVNESVPGATDGSIDLTMSGGTPPYDYLWSTGETSQNISGLTGANIIYSVKVTDAQDCQITDQVTLQTGCFPPATLCDDGNPDTFNDTEDGNCNCLGIPCPVIHNGLETRNISCYGRNDGSASVNPSGGNPPYTINWSSGTSSPDVSILPAGAYTVSVTDVNGCQSVTDFVLSQPLALSSTISRVNESEPGANDGFIDLRISGGTMPYDYMWSTGATTRDISGLTGANTIYSVTVTDAGGCQITKQVTLQTGCFPPATLCDDGDPDTYNDMEDGTCNCKGIPCPVIHNGLETRNISCFGGSDGSALVNPSGGDPPYIINWSSGNSGLSISDLSSGDYAVSVTDAHGCQTVSNFELSESSPLLSTLIGVNESSPGAGDGSIDLRISGGTEPHSVLWSTGETTHDISGLTGANTIYSVTVTDARGCQIADLVTIQTGCLPPGTLCDDGNPDTNNDMEDGNCNCKGMSCLVIVDLELNNISCFGRNDGSALVNPSGGHPPYNINWSSGTYGPDSRNLIAGNYTVTVTDVHGCQTVLNFELSEPSPLSSTLIGVNESAPGAGDGSIDLTISGGTIPHSFLWSTGETTQYISGLSGANAMYTVTITDALGCQITDQVTLQTGCLPPGTLCDDGNPDTFNDVEDGLCNCIGTACAQHTLDFQISHVTCFGQSDGSIRVDTLDFVYKNILWSTGSKDLMISNLPQGNYSLTIMGEDECTFVYSFQILEPPLIEIVLTGIDESAVSAKDGSVAANFVGGTGPYQISWSNGSSESLIQNLAGNQFYYVEVKDQSGCIRTDSIYIGGFVCNDLQESDFEILTTPPTDCEANGEMVIKPIAPSRDLQFSLDGLIYQSGPRFKSLSNGKYQFFIKDPSNGCQLTIKHLQLGPATNLAIEITEPTNCESHDGAIMIHDPEHEISLSENGPWYFEKIDQLSTGNYQVVARKIGDHCIYVVGNFVLGSPGYHSENLLTISRQHAHCKAGLGKIEISPFDEMLQFSIDRGSTWYRSNQIYEVSPGVYDLLIQTEEGCSYNYGSIEVDMIAGINVRDLQVNNPSDCNSQDGFVEIQSEVEVNYSLDQGSTWKSTGYFTDLTVGQYQIWLRSSDESCLDSLQINLTAGDKNLLIAVEEKLNPSCQGAEDGYIRLMLNDNPSEYNWSWTDGFEGQEVGGLPAGSYEVIVSKNQFCRNSLQIDLIDPPPPELLFPLIDTVVYCQGQSLMITLPDSNLTYNWFRNDQFVGDSNHYQVTIEGQYLVIGMDRNGCEVNRTFDIAYSNQVFDANFLISGLCLAGEPTPAIEISWPVPDDVFWEIEGGTIVDTFLNQSIIIFEQPGNYVIRMKAIKNGCMSVIEKRVTVVDDPALLDFPADPLLSQSIQLNLFPNPNRGNFNVLIELSELSDIQLRIYNEEAILVYSTKFPQITTLSQNIDLMGSIPGLYTLLVQTNVGWQTISFIIN